MANEKRNRLREEAPEEETAAPKRRSKKASATSEGKWSRFTAFFTDTRTHRVFGLLLVLSSAFLLVAFASFLFTWRVDQDLVGRSWGEIFSPEVKVDNWLGKFGALTAHQFMHTWFGLAAFAFPLWSFLCGIRILLGTWLLPTRRTLGWTAMALLWIPALFGFFFRGELTFLGGGLGVVMTRHLTSFLGNFGAGALLVFAAGAFAVYTFNLSFGWVNDLLAKLKKPEAEPVAEEIAEPVIAQPGVRMKATPDVVLSLSKDEPVMDASTPLSVEEEEERGGGGGGRRGRRDTGARTGDDTHGSGGARPLPCR
ncbi:MAG: DNA translocase FtsK 4TM domain-containing protein [Flavobacteriales bacterium]|nr:DNA translocase FtsK 4TM domain-containing protein [Flavobacteriales bacterium]